MRSSAWIFWPLAWPIGLFVAQFGLQVPILLFALDPRFLVGFAAIAAAVPVSLAAFRSGTAPRLSHWLLLTLLTAGTTFAAGVGRRPLLRLGACALARGPPGPRREG